MGNHESVTRICNICLKIANVPKDCEVINTVSHIYVCMCMCSLHILGPLGYMERDFLFFKNHERLLDETKDRGYLDSRKSIKRYETKF